MPIDRITAREQRERIPTVWLIDFNSQSNKALDAMAADTRLPEAVRAYAEWELEYREAFGLVQRYNPYTGEMQRFDVSSDEGAVAAKREIEAEAAQFAAGAIQGDGLVSEVLRKRQQAATR